MTYIIVVVYGALAIGPEGVEETVVCAGSGRRGACSEVASVCSFGFKDEVQWGGEHGSSAAEGEQK